MGEVDNQHVWRLNIWCGNLGNKIIGPHFFERTLNGEVYGDFLLNILPQFLEDVLLNVKINIWFQQDGCYLAHYVRKVRVVDSQPNVS